MTYDFPTKLKMAVWERFAVSESFLPCDASAERGDATVSRLSVCLSVCDVQVSGTHRLEFFENNFVAEYLKASALADPQHGRSGAKGTPPKLGLNRGGVSST